MPLPARIQAELQQAEALEAADAAARAQAQTPLSTIAQLVAPPAPVAAPTPVPPPAPAAPAHAPDNFEHKYRVLQGMYAADVTAIKGQISTLTAQITAKQAEQAPARAEPAAADVETFGKDMMDMVQRYVTGAVDALASRVDALEQQQGTVRQDMATSKEQQFYTLLDNLVPTWRAVNESTDWLKWLAVVDEVYGVTRQEALDHAFRQLNAAQVAKVFKAFLASVPAAPVPPSLDDQLTPDGAGSPQLPTPEAKPILSTAAITAFYNDKARGVYRGREAEADSIEAQIDTAVAEGRVR